MIKTLQLMSIMLLTGILTAFGQEKPVKYNTLYNGDFVYNSMGGIKKGNKYLGLASFKVEFSTEGAGFWKGGTFFVNAAAAHGGEPTRELTGDFQGISNIEAGNQFFFQELWFKQTINDFTVTAGLQDLAAGFTVSEHAALFLNGSFGMLSTISHNVPAPVYPLTALGLQAEWNVSESFDAKAAFFDGQTDDFENNPYNLSWHLSMGDGIFAISEVEYNTDIVKGLKGSYKIGAYSHYHRKTPEVSGSPDGRNNYGAYFVADQSLIDDIDGTKLAVFTQVGLSPYENNENNIYLGMGINCAGLFSSRKEDCFGLALAYAGFSDKINKNETAIEFSYMAKITEYISLQPDLQYIINPAGTGERLNNTLAGIVRLGISL